MSDAPNWLILTLIAVALLAVSVPGLCRALRRAADTCADAERDLTRREDEQ